MEFYYLKETSSGEPKTEQDFKYLAYIQNKTSKPIELPFEKGVFYSLYPLTEMPKWNIEDDVIDVVAKHTNQIVVQFKKKHDEVGLTIWEQV